MAPTPCNSASQELPTVPGRAADAAQPPVAQDATRRALQNVRRRSWGAEQLDVLALLFTAVKILFVGGAIARVTRLVQVSTCVPPLVLLVTAASCAAARVLLTRPRWAYGTSVGSSSFLRGLWTNLPYPALLASAPLAQPEPSFQPCSMQGVPHGTPFGHGSAAGSRSVLKTAEQ